MIHIHDLCFSYGKRTILENLQCSVSPGECLILAGPNGSGKSTLLSLIAGLLRPKAGSVVCEGRIGYVPQGIALFQNATVEENLKFFASLCHSRVPDRLPFGLDTLRTKKVSTLSIGTQKRVSIACALPGDPEILLLDEPCAGLDLIYQEELNELLLREKARGAAIVYVAHEPAEFARCYDRILFLGEGTPHLFTRRSLLEYAPPAGNRSLVAIFHTALAAMEEK